VRLSINPIISTNPYFERSFHLAENPFLADVYTLKGTYLPNLKFLGSIVPEIIGINPYYRY